MSPLTSTVSASGPADAADAGHEVPRRPASAHGSWYWRWKPSSVTLKLVMALTGIGYYPRLGVKDAYFVVRRGEGDHLFVLVPGGRTISWPKLRALLSVNRLSMPSADDALEVTGYVRGTITPFGSLSDLPVIADAEIPAGPVSIGGGAHGVAFTVDSEELVGALAAHVADVTEAE